MEIKEVIEILESHNKWCRGSDDVEPTTPKLLGIAIDRAIEELMLCNVVTHDNPIKDNRIVKNITFALRFLNFSLETNCVDACSEDEKTAMVSHAVSLLEYQIGTAKDQYELDYLERCNAKSILKKGLKFLGKT